MEVIGAVDLVGKVITVSVDEGTTHVRNGGGAIVVARGGVARSGGMWCCIWVGGTAQVLRGEQVAGERVVKIAMVHRGRRRRTAWI
ncbi:hypothetical protein U1Q18_013750 [Sarracenia purpurea var. burkii]